MVRTSECERRAVETGAQAHLEIVLGVVEDNRLGIWV